jgi:hypothetical protein
VFELPNGEFRLGEVGKTCGTQNLYYNAIDDNPMRVEHLFSKLESKTAQIFQKICAAVTEGIDNVEILEKDIQTLFKFMILSSRRSVQYRDEINSPYRENDFMFQRMFEIAKKSGRSGNPDDFWLEELLYLLESSHDDILADATKSPENANAKTYKAFIDNYTLQIWKAASGYEFFLNERLVDFEGDTDSWLGMEEKETGPQLIWMTNEDMIHLIVPISPEVAVVFCNESRCWESPFAESMHRANIPFPENSLLKNAPHKDVINIDVPSKKRGKKTWPATVAWRLNIGTLCRDHHRIITSYSLSHANSVIVVHRRVRFERAKRELEAFGKDRAETWKKRGSRFGYPNDRRQLKENITDTSQKTDPSQAQIDKIVESHVSILDEVLHMMSTPQEALKLTKENALKCWEATCIAKLSKGLISPNSDGRCIIYPEIKAVLEAAYAPKHPDHKDLVTIDFIGFLIHAISEKTFAQLCLLIEKKIFELRDTIIDETPFASTQTVADSIVQQDDDLDGIYETPTFKLITSAVQSFDVLQWMFEDRQDILATFVKQISEPMKPPRVTRIRAPRK